jgi:uncharacterized protein (UPF0297 family)
MNEAGAAGELAALRERVAELEAAESQRRRAEQVQEALYRIAETASAARDMHEFYAAMHQIVGELMDASNFFITLYDEERQMINGRTTSTRSTPTCPTPTHGIRSAPVRRGA